jgi:hypothetical protein
MMAVGLLLVVLGVFLATLFDLEKTAGLVVLVGFAFMFASLVRWLWLVMP